MLPNESGPETKTILHAVEIDTSEPERQRRAPGGPSLALWRSGSDNVSILAACSITWFGVLDECFGPFRGQQRKPLLRLGTCQHVADFSKDFGAEAKRYFAFIYQAETGSGWTRGPPCALQEDHAVINRA